METELKPQYDSRKKFYGKANVRTENGKTILKSYNTDVAYIKNGQAVVNGTYSNTTLRHIKEFLKQNNFKADTSKQILSDYDKQKFVEKKSSTTPNRISIKKYTRTPSKNKSYWTGKGKGMRY